jgi:hypothetical protein
MDRWAVACVFRKMRGIGTNINGLLHAMAKALALACSVMAWFNQHLALLSHRASCDGCHNLVI